MITLASQITYTPPAIGGKTFPPVTTSTLPVTFRDSPDLQTVWAFIKNVPKPIVLWQGAAYSAIGDWTQNEANAQVLEMLGSNPAQVIENLFQP